MDNNVVNVNAKPSSNISEMVSKFAKACKFRSIGVFYNENPNQNHPGNVGNRPSADEDFNVVTGEKESDAEKIHPYPVVVSSNLGGKWDINQLFDMVSALKLAYVQLQGAHCPYDPKRIVAADECFVAKLDALCKIKRSYKQKQFTKAKLLTSTLDCIRQEAKASELLIEKLKCQISEKNSEVVRLRQKLDNLDAGNALLVRKIRQRSLEMKCARVLNIDMLKDTFVAASKSIHDFAKPMISLMKASGWDLDLAANAIEEAVLYSNRSHKKYVFEAYIVRRMFHGMSLKSSYNVDDVLKFEDPLNCLIHNLNSGFADFCRHKYLLVVHPSMEMSFFGNLDQRLFVLGGNHPRTAFYQKFTVMAKYIWMLQGIATSIDPNAETFTVKRGSRYADTYMESVDEQRLPAISDRGRSNFIVEFMVMPGFRIGDTLLKSRVYISECKLNSEQ